MGMQLVIPEVTFVGPNGGLPRLAAGELQRSNRADIGHFFEGIIGTEWKLQWTLLF